MTLIGTKGDTNFEAVYCIFTVILTIGVFATILSSVGMIWDEME